MFGLCRLSCVLLVMVVGVIGSTTGVAAAAEVPATVGIVYTCHTTYHKTAVELKKVLEQRGHKCVSVELKGVEARKPEPKPETQSGTSAPGEDTQPTAKELLAESLKPLVDARPAVIVTVGIKATSLVLEAVPQTPVVFCMVPNAIDASFMARGNPHLTRIRGVTTEVLPAEQIGWISRLSPRVRHLGILSSDRSKRTVQAIVEAADKHGRIKVTVIQAKKDAFPAAIDALNGKKCDGVLMIADASVYNAANVKRLLLWGLRQKHPVWTFSGNLVKAGAFAGLHIDEVLIGRQIADVVQEVVKGKKPPAGRLYFPRQLDSAVNERTAEMIGVSISRRDLETVTDRFGGE